MQRHRTPELMDDPAIDRATLSASLRYIRWVNRWLGGESALVGRLRAWSRRWPPGATITLLDIATGSADLPLAAVRWARAHNFDLRVTAVDVHETTLALAREHIAREPQLAASISIEHADALKLMDVFTPGSFDYVHAGLFLHHLPEIEVLTVLRIMDRLARRGIVWNDLMRSRVGRAAIGVMTIGQPRVVQHDARVSVEAGFTRREAIDLARRSGIDYASYRSNFFTHRFVLAGEKP